MSVAWNLRELTQREVLIYVMDVFEHEIGRIYILAIWLESRKVLRGGMLEALHCHGTLLPPKLQVNPLIGHNGETHVKTGPSI
jgi:hypothetical protein